MNLLRRRFFFLFLYFVSAIACSDPLKHPPGGISGRVFLQPTPPQGEDWAYVRMHNDLADDTVSSDPSTNNFAFTDLQVGNLEAIYDIEAFRTGYITHRNQVIIRAGATLVNYDITLHRGERRDTTFQDSVYPAPSYAGCRDTYISTPDSAAVHGLETVIIIGGGHADSLKRGLIRFDFNWSQYYPQIDTLPMAIERAVLSLFVDSVKTLASVQMAAFNLEHSFDEEAASWLGNGAVPWPGGAGGSFGDLSSDTITVSSLTYGWVDFSVEEIADEWLESSSPGSIMIKLVDEDRHAEIFARTSESSPASVRPRLRLAINYLSKLKLDQ